MTKKQALVKAGYEPKHGRPLKFGEETIATAVRIPVSLWNRIPRPRVDFIRNLIRQALGDGR